MRKRITVAGNMLVDRIKTIDFYPDRGMLANIISESAATGGCVPNTAMSLSAIDKSMSICAAGLVGCDADGDFILRRLSESGIDTAGVGRTSTVGTGYTDVMTTAGGERTFFHYRGANAEFCVDDALRVGLGGDIFHLGYLLLLDGLDCADEQYGTASARLLKAARDSGAVTSVDIASEQSDRFRRVVTPCLAFCSNVIINETEAGRLVGEDPRDGSGKIDADAVRRIAKRILALGVSDRVVIHCPEAGFVLNGAGRFTCVPSLELPQDYVKGTVGAGDAFCACCLDAIARGCDDTTMLEFASCGAACNLSQADAVSGMRPRAEIEKLDEMFARRRL